MMDLSAIGLTGEPTAAQAIRDGAALVTMSGDKLLGGPQAGLILGDRALVDRIRKNPLTRSYRVDKLTLAALEATLALYREPARAWREIPTLAMLAEPVDELRARARAIVAAVGHDRVVEAAMDASVGGGAFPTARIPSAGIAIDGESDRIESALRRHEPPIIGRAAGGRVLLDLRTVEARHDTTIIAALRGML
jgi:L-seryl-tRNA(Ser) seleniumtransferase